MLTSNQKHYVRESSPLGGLKEAIISCNIEKEQTQDMIDL